MKVKARSLCARHYSAARRAETVETCKVLGCEKPASLRAARLCEAHYAAWRRAGRGRSRSFTGLGVLACKLCGRPLLEHGMEPCPLRFGRPLVGVGDPSPGRLR